MAPSAGLQVCAHCGRELQATYPLVTIQRVLRPVGQAGRGCGPLSCWQAGPGSPVTERLGKGQRQGGAWPVWKGVLGWQRRWEDTWVSGREGGRQGGEAAWWEGPQQEVRSWPWPRLREGSTGL